MAKIKNTRTVADKMEKEFASALKKSTKERNKLPAIIRNGVKVKMPLELVLMRASFTKIQLNIIVTVLKVIGDKVNEIINKKMKEGDIMSLFSKEEFGEDENSIRFIIKKKEFGISSTHIDELKGALRLMRMIPVDLPITGKVTGEKYTKYTNLCSVVLPDDDLKDYCIVEMDRKVASHILHEDLRYATIVDSISRKLRSKYSIRIYWRAMLSAYNGGATIKLEDLKKEVCGTEDKYDRYPSFEREVLRKAKRDMDDLYDQGLWDYTFDYHPTKEDRDKSKEKGNPEYIYFTIKKRPDYLLESKVDEEEFNRRVKEIENVLLGEFGISPNRIKSFTSRITNENIEGLMEKISKLQAIRKEDSSKVGGFFATSIINYFEESNPYVEIPSDVQDVESADITTAEENIELLDQKHWRKQWYDCQKEFDYIVNYIKQDSAKEALRCLFQCLSYDRFEENSKCIILVAPTLFIREFIEKNLEEIFVNIITKHYGEGVTMEIEQKFQGAQLAEWAEKVQKLSLQNDVMEAINSYREKVRESYQKKYNEVWLSLRNEIVELYNNEEVRETFINHVAFGSFNDGKLTLLFSNNDIRELIKQKYSDQLLAAIHKYFGNNTQLMYQFMTK